MSLKQEILEATKIAMKSRAKQDLIVLRGVSAAFKQIEIDEQKELSDSEQLAVIDKLVKQRKDSEKQFRDAGRNDLADKEHSEQELLNKFLPEPLTNTEISELIDSTIAKVPETGMAAMGKIISIIKPKIQGRADIGIVSKIIKDKL